MFPDIKRYSETAQDWDFTSTDPQKTNSLVIVVIFSLWKRINLDLFHTHSYCSVDYHTAFVFNLTPHGVSSILCC